MTLSKKGLGLLLSITILSACTTLSKNKSESKQLEPDAPKLTKPVVKRIWVKDTISDDGTEYSEGHWKYILENKSVWSK